MCEHKVTSGCHYAACHRDFTSVTAFDRHQRGSAWHEGKIICLDPMVAQDEKGRQIFDVRPGTGKFSLASHGENPWSAEVRDEH